MSTSNLVDEVKYTAKVLDTWNKAYKDVIKDYTINFPDKSTEQCIFLKVCSEFTDRVQDKLQEIKTHSNIRWAELHKELYLIEQEGHFIFNTLWLEIFDSKPPVKVKKSFTDKVKSLDLLELFTILWIGLSTSFFIFAMLILLQVI